MKGWNPLTLSMVLVVVACACPARAEYVPPTNQDYTISYASPNEAADTAAQPDDKGGSVAGGLVMVAILIGLYFIPFLVASGRALGWTVLGWLLALIWACTAVRKTASA